jgi:hypothetical protein
MIMHSGRDAADAGDDAGAGRAAVFLIHAKGGPEAELEQLRAFIEQHFEALADGEAALGALGFGGFGAAALAVFFCTRGRLSMRAPASAWLRRSGRSSRWRRAGGASRPP